MRNDYNSWQLYEYFYVQSARNKLLTFSSLCIDPSYLLQGFFLQNIFGSFAQSASINGFVSDTENGETLISANVGLLDTRKGTATNTLGYYSLTDIEPGTYMLFCSFVGMKHSGRKYGLSPERIFASILNSTLKMSELG
ncbi:carboxypeptidase-like regulatory domain-containing protein [Rhodohalobacter sp.]|uniref:carboxypeptidase-like regulatory domain-containing protein n=1 Tax=Rhodohalobacter sp. TaxID=1974210 RepID=UPI002ACD88B0|nr:carboxypeptidase-like regulatory domain-containing protein [Rhodohalobacter sp.]MDZ7756297.1 carboxypeptidase-like regulatory domain-containing protein [Rhodohalobacter sp.]